LDTDSVVTVALNKMPDGNGGYIALGGRSSTDGNDSYRLKVRFLNTTDKVTLYLVKVTGTTETNLVPLVTLPASSVSYTAGDQLRLRLQLQGQSPTTVRGKAWEVGTPEPAGWQITATDNEPSLQDAGGVTLWSFLSGNATVAPLTFRFDDLSVTTLP